MAVIDKKIGVLAVTPEGAAKAYRDMSVAFYGKYGPYNNPTMTMIMQPLINHVESFGDKEVWINLIQKGIDDLVAQDVDVICMPANSSHLVVSELDFRGLEFINMVDEAVRYLKGTDKNTLVLGTKVSLSDKLYLKDLPKNCFVPSVDDIERLNNIIIKEMVLGHLSQESRNFILRMIEQNQKIHDIENIFFACTELPCFFNPSEIPLPVIDSMDIMIKKCL